MDGQMTANGRVWVKHTLCRLEEEIHGPMGPDGTCTVPMVTLISARERILDLEAELDRQIAARRADRGVIAFSWIVVAVIVSVLNRVF